MTDPETPEQHDQRHGRTEGEKPRPPFDTSDLNDIPHTNADDPPYQNWWVVTDHEQP